MTRTDEGYILVSRFDEDAEAEITPAKDTKKIEEKVEDETEEEIEDEEVKDKIQKQDKEEKPKKKRGMFGFFRK